MTNRILAVLLLATFACGKKQIESPVLTEISYEIDTVQIDSKDEFLFLNMGLFMSDYDPVADLLYNLNPETSRMEIIDLDKNELKEIVPFDQDGPNAVKEMFTSGIKVTDTGNKWFTDYFSLIQVDVEGNKLNQFRLNNQEIPGDSLAENYKIDGMGKISRSGKYFVSHYGDYVLNGEGLQGLAVVDLENKTKRLIPLDVFRPLEKYLLTSPDGERAGARAGEWNFISLSDSVVVHSNSAQNRLMTISLESGETREVKLSSKLVGDEKPGLYPKQANSVEQFEEYNELKKQELTFGPWIYDQENGRFWRISREKTGGTVENPEFTFVVTALDKNLKQIAETQLSASDALPFDGLPSVSFFRKGMLYMFLNQNDELTFVRLKPNFETL